MDIAQMIIETAEKLQMKENEENMVEFIIKLKNVENNIKDSSCFKIIPVKTDSSKVTIVFGKTKWTLSHASEEIIKLMRNIIRQVLRNFIKTLKNNIIMTEIKFKILYRKELLFNDEYFIEEEAIYMSDLTTWNFPHEADNDELQNVESIFLNYCSMCLKMTFYDSQEKSH